MYISRLVLNSCPNVCACVCVWWRWQSSLCNRSGKLWHSRCNWAIEKALFSCMTILLIRFCSASTFKTNWQCSVLIDVVDRSFDCLLYLEVFARTNNKTHGGYIFSNYEIILKPEFYDWVLIMGKTPDGCCFFWHEKQKSLNKLLWNDSFDYSLFLCGVFRGLICWQSRFIAVYL